jgi:tRNA-uridine 2-sulfurtransferase
MIFKARLSLVKPMKRVKGLAMFSGGLDSILAIKLIQKQGVEVEALNFSGFFCSCKAGSGVAESAKRLGVPLKTVEMDERYLRMLRNPKHGYGRNMNPCVDCKIFMLKEAKKYAKEIGAAFVFTGEVLDERPMSQHYPALKTIEEKSGLKGRLLRPLSARLLPETVAEKSGLVKRDMLLAVRGRSRKPQIALAREFGVTSYPSPAGGCLLTESEFANRLRDLFQHRKRCSVADVALLRLGRHFRLGENKFIVGRNEVENKALVAGKAVGDYVLEIPDVAGPITILQGRKTKKAVEAAAALTAFYSDAKTTHVTVNYGKEKLDKTTNVKVPTREEIERMRV